MQTFHLLPDRFLFYSMAETSTHQNNSLVTYSKVSNNIVYSLTGFGVFFRIFHFFQNRSQWMDEMFLSVSLVKYDFLQLATVPLEYEQKAPIGFLWSVKLCLTLFGNGDKAMRLFPLLCGIASLFLFVFVAKKFLSDLGVIISIGILALSPHLIYHSVEAKQYSTEVLCTILALYLYSRFYNRSDLKSLIYWGLAGGLLVWFAFSSIFVLAGMAGGLSLYHLYKKDWRAFSLYLIPFVIWMVSFGLNFFLFTNKHTESDWLIEWFKYREGFMPLSLKGSVLWLTKKIFTLLNFPLGLSWFPLPERYHHIAPLLILVRMAIFHLLLIILGVIYSFKKNIHAFWILLSPILLHLFAASIMVYPFYERLTVYLSPLFILLIAFGSERMLLFFRPKATSVSNKQSALPEPEYLPQSVKE